MLLVTGHGAILQSFTLTCGREERFSIAVLILPRVTTVDENKQIALVEHDATRHSRG